MRIHPRLELEEEDEDGPFCGRAVCGRGEAWANRGLTRSISPSPTERDAGSFQAQPQW